MPVLLKRTLSATEIDFLHLGSCSALLYIYKNLVQKCNEPWLEYHEEIQYILERHVYEKV